MGPEIQVSYKIIGKRYIVLYFLPEYKIKNVIDIDFEDVFIQVKNNSLQKSQDLLEGYLYHSEIVHNVAMSKISKL